MKKNILVISKGENMERARYLAVGLSEDPSQYDAFVCKRVENKDDITGFGEIKDIVSRNKIHGAVLDNYETKHLYTMNRLGMVSTTINPRGEEKVNAERFESTAKMPIIIIPFDYIEDGTIDFLKKHLDKYIIE